MTGRLFFFRLPEWKEDEKEETLREVFPTATPEPDTKQRKWCLTRLFGKKRDAEQEKARANALITYPKVKGHVHIIVKAKLSGDGRRYSWASINIPRITTYQEFAGFALKEIRRQNLHPSRMPTRMLLRGLVVDWGGVKKVPRQCLPSMLDEDNFAGSLMIYDRGVVDPMEPAEIELLVDIERQPGGAQHPPGNVRALPGNAQPQPNKGRFLALKSFSTFF